MAFLIFCQTFFGSVLISFANTIFTNKLESGLRQYAPSTDSKSVFAAGATGIREVVTPQQLPGVLVAYSKSVDDVFYLALGAAIAGFGLAWGMGWVDVRKKNKNETNKQ